MAMVVCGGGEEVVLKQSRGCRMIYYLHCFLEQELDKLRLQTGIHEPGTKQLYPHSIAVGGDFAFSPALKNNH